MATIMPDARVQRWAEMQPRGRFERMAGELCRCRPNAGSTRPQGGNLARAGCGLSGHPTCGCATA